MRRVLFSLLLLSVFLSSNVVSAENIAQGVKVIVIDAGHGGPKFPGATYRGVHEKDLNLKVALKLGALIEKRMPDITVVYTRKTDKQFSADLNKDLQARADIANKAEGDFFISIHANAARATGARGVETLIMGESPLETRTNENVLFANNKEEFLDMSNEKTAAIVRAYIQNLQFTYGEYSEMMARLIQKNYAKSGRVARGIKRQPLKVLYATDMPSVLTEIGFMSNAEELRYMCSEKGQNQIAEDLYNAVKEYVENVRKSLLIDEPAKSPAKSTAPATAKPETAPETKPAAAKPDSQAKGVPAKSEKPVAGSATAVKDSAPAAGKPVSDKSSQKPASAPKSDPKTRSTASVSTPAAADTGRAYTVQIMASSTALSSDNACFGSQRGKVTRYTATGSYKYKYCVGRYRDRAEAQRAASSLRKEFSGAFVIEVENGKIVK